jgi:hypothetical protein
MVCAQQRLNLAAQLGVAGTRSIEKRRTRQRVAIQRRVKDLLDLPPALGRHRLNSCVSHALAARQSRPTVSVDTFKASAVSSRPSWPPLTSDLAVSVFVASPKAPATWHFVAQQTSCVSPPGDFTTAVDMPWESTTTAWFWLAARGGHRHLSSVVSLNATKSIRR